MTQTGLVQKQFNLRKKRTRTYCHPHIIAPEQLQEAAHAFDYPAFGFRQLLECLVLLSYKTFDAPLIKSEAVFLRQNPKTVEISLAEILCVIIPCCYLDTILSQNLIKGAKVQNLRIGYDAVEIEYYRSKHKRPLFDRHRSD
jgi:hypothetical protein